MAAADRDKVPVLEILLGSVLIAWKNAGSYSAALSIPTALLVVVWVASLMLPEQVSGLSAWAIWAIYKLAFVVFAVTCHRLVLIGRPRRPYRIGFSVRELRFLVWLVVVYAIVGFILFAPLNSLLYMRVGLEWLPPGDRAYYGQVMFSIPAMYVLARLCLVFPATAMDRSCSLKESWTATRGNGWRIAVIVGLYPWLISIVRWLVLRENATLVEQVLVGLSFYVGLALEVFALSLTYRAVTGMGGHGELRA